MLVVGYVSAVSWWAFTSLCGSVVVGTGSAVYGKGEFLSLLVGPGGGGSRMSVR